MTHILVIDDEENITNMLERQLSRENYDVSTATTKAEALKLMENEAFPIVILDIKFPETSGQELLGKLKDINPLANVLMITGYSTIQNVVECIGEGAVDYFTKPIDFDDLLNSVDHCQHKLNRWNKTVGMGEPLPEYEDDR